MADKKKLEQKYLVRYQNNYIYSIEIVASSLSEAKEKVKKKNGNYKIIS